jgi:hypothetical protein
VWLPGVADGRATVRLKALVELYEGGGFRFRSREQPSPGGAERVLGVGKRPDTFTKIPNEFSLAIERRRVKMNFMWVSGVRIEKAAGTSGLDRKFNMATLRP